MDPAGELRIFEDGHSLKGLEAVTIQSNFPSKII